MAGTAVDVPTIQCMACGTCVPLNDAGAPQGHLCDAVVMVPGGED